MPLDPEIAQANRAATARIRALADRCSDADLATRVGEHWTVAVVFAHLAFWDRRPLGIIGQVEREGRLEERVVDPIANDYSLPLWLAIPPREAVRLALEASEELDSRLERASDDGIATILAHNERWVRRHLHRNEHLDEAEAALAG
jgi:hypothetical protein